MDIAQLFLVGMVSGTIGGIVAIGIAWLVIDKLLKGQDREM